MLAAAVTVALVAELALRGGAVGLVVPDAGPRTSEERARASLVCAQVVNSLRGELPECDVPLVTIADDAPLRLELPRGGEQPNDRRYPIVLEDAEGLLTSDSTRIPGLVSIADVGRERLQTVPHDDPAGYLERLDRRIAENGRARIPAFLLALAVLAALALVRPGAAVAGFAGVLAANLVLGALGVSALWAVLLAIAIGALALAPLPLLPLSFAIVGAYLGALATGPWVALSPLGPTQNARFFGLSNLLAALLLVPALVAASRRATFLPASVLAVVTVAGSAFGADAGTGIVLVAACAVLAWGLFPPVLAVPAAAAVAGTAALAVLLGPETHVADSGAGDVLDRMRLTVERLADDWLVALIVAAALALLAVLVARGPRRPLPVAFAVAVAVSMVVNDSPFEVALAGLVGYLTVARYDARRDEAALLRS